jgi:hypothetical protein
MAAYRIDLNSPATLVPCTFVPSTAAPGKTLSVNEDGSTIVVEPDGSQTRTVPPGDPNWDSPWTQATVIDGFLVYRSATERTLGVPRGYKMVGA